MWILMFIDLNIFPSQDSLVCAYTELVFQELTKLA